MLAQVVDESLESEFVLEFEDSGTEGPPQQNAATDERRVWVPAFWEMARAPLAAER